MENSLTYTNPPYECEMNCIKNQKIVEKALEKYQTWLDECDLKESIDIFKKFTEFHDEYTTCMGLFYYKELGILFDSPLQDYLLSKNPKSLIPLIPLKLYTDNLTQDEKDQGYERISHLGDGVLGLCFDKPLESEVEITFHIRNSEWKENIVVPKGTVNYKLPRFICTLWLQNSPLLVKGITSGTTLLGTLMSQDMECITHLK